MRSAVGVSPQPASKPVKVAELVAALMLAVPESYYGHMDGINAEFHKDRLEGRCAESIQKTWRPGIARDDWQVLAAADFEEAYRDNNGWPPEHEDRFR